MPDFGPRWLLRQKDPLGKGGQGHAYPVSEAQNPNSQSYVAKLLNGPKLTDQSPRWKRLEQEIDVCRSFDHPHVVRVVDSGHTQHSRYPYFVMPFYSGGSLQEGRGRFQSPLGIFRLFADICDGLAYVHTKGVVHSRPKAGQHISGFRRSSCGRFWSLLSV